MKRRFFNFFRLVWGRVQHWIPETWRDRAVKAGDWLVEEYRKTHAVIKLHLWDGGRSDSDGTSLSVRDEKSSKGVFGGLGEDLTSEGKAIHQLTAYVGTPRRFGLKVLLVAFFVVVIWGGLAPLKSYAPAHGTVVLSGSRKIVQHLEGGIVRDILVENGDFVTEGQVLLRLNDTQSRSALELLQKQYGTARAIEARLEAERSHQSRLVFPEDVMNTNDPEVLKAVAIQQEQFESRMASLHGRRDVLEQRILQIKEQAVGAETRLAAVIDQIKVLESDLKNYEALSKKGLARKTDTNQLRRTLIELEGNRGSLVSEIARIKQSEIETKIEIMNISKEFDERINEEMKNVSLQLSDLQEKIKSQQDIQDRSVIKAPSSGIIANTKLHTVGGVIPAQQPLMEIIPQDDQLVIEAVLMPQDIEPVHVGAEAKINLSAFKSRLVPKVEGIVTYVAPDVSTDPRPGMGPEMQGRPYYLVRLEVPKKELERLAYKIDLYPGMPAEVFIVTGSRTMLEYMLTPLKESFSRAFIER